VQLDKSSGHTGDSTTAQSIVRDPDTGSVTLALNPGRIDPKNAAWTKSRKPLSAAFTTLCEQSTRVFAINVHLASKDGSSPIQGDWLPAVNGKVEQRVDQANVLRSFVAADPDANVVLLGDCNEFSHVKPLQIVAEVLSEVLHKDPVERYSYIFEQNSQVCDHFLWPQVKGD
jgi:predicted extracellular nuclease